MGAANQIFYASFGAGYRTTEWTYGDDGFSIRATRHPKFPDRIDGRGYVEIHATTEGRARYLARFYFDNHYAGLYKDTHMWEDWMLRSAYETSPMRVLQQRGTLRLGIIDDAGLRWEP